MAENFLSNFVTGTFKKFLAVPERKDFNLDNPQKFLIVRQHNQLGDLLAGVSLFRAIKETYPGSKITLIVSQFNYPGLIKNKFIDRLFIFNKKKLYNPVYFKNFLKLLKEDYDVTIVPVVVSISFTSNLIAGISNAKVKIGPQSLDGKRNKSDYFFNRRIKLDWRRHPDSNVSERSLDIVRPFGINTDNFRSEITFDKDDMEYAEKFISSLTKSSEEKLIGLHVGAGKIQNRWSLEKYSVLIKRLNESFAAKFYLTGSSLDKNEVNYIVKKNPFEIKPFINKTIPQVAALISKSDLFISNDTGIMHVAGTTGTPQVSIFGPTNPFNWAPIGTNKYFIRKSDLIDDISVQDVFEICRSVLENRSENEIA